MNSRIATLDFATVRAITEELAAPLSAEDQTVQSMPDVSPTKWHRAHVTWFFETFVLADRPGYEPYDPRYRYLFNSYYEAVGPRHARPERGLITRPGVAEISDYRRHVDQAMAEVLSTSASSDLVQLGLHHEQQHQELILMDIKHVLSCNPTQPAYGEVPWASCVASPSPTAGEWLDHDGGVVEVGHDGRGFAFDNEGPRHEALLRPFEIASCLVTCSDWLEFMDDSGYRRPELWMSDGWAAVTTGGWEAPGYWHRDGDGWAVFSLAGTVDVDPAAPVSHVSWYEADAFARWAGARLPLEPEWEVAAALHGGDWFGHVWQWTASPYTSYPGFAPAAGAVGEYNGKFMVNQQVLRGSSSATPPGHARLTYRNFFPAGARWMFGGLRLAR